MLVVIGVDMAVMETGAGIIIGMVQVLGQVDIGTVETAHDLTEDASNQTFYVMIVMICGFFCISLEGFLKRRL